MKFRLILTYEAQVALQQLQDVAPKKYKKVLKTLGLMEINLRHPGLRTHKYESLQGPNQEDVFEAYVENRTPGAYRVFWFYGPEAGQITILAITSHP
ncbi:hypothetical protein GS597_15210 [Synechococcales cyanobacterium C]|uniref:Uncharacterized protein n=1 Tax=Petrachloros mirabilis ULC683 TaxID=2781853 RepID=A0A8K2A1M9_9CYAN|nr:hypothetical protein [Petrachloros mirabilis]NCJ07832.1 hypothetical protein [Petrachloros mirabilis ULC683]